MGLSSGWIPLDQEQELLARRTVEIGGVQTQVMTSPLDLPLAIKGDYDDVSGWLRVDFKYTFDEPADAEHPAPDVCFHIGKHSGRLLAVQVQIGPGRSPEEAAGASVKLIVAALKERLASANRRRREDVRPENLRIAGLTIQNRLVPAFG